MTETLPLHARVAEALGWRDIRHGGWARFGGDSVIEDNRAWEGRDPIRRDDSSILYPVPRYDLSWEATGPLVEKYGIDLVMLWPGDAGNDGFCWLATSAAEQRSPAPQAVGPVEGPTPLTAVCSLLLALSEAGKLEK